LRLRAPWRLLASGKMMKSSPLSVRTEDHLVQFGIPSAAKGAFYLDDIQFLHELLDPGQKHQVRAGGEVPQPQTQ